MIEAFFSRFLNFYYKYYLNPRDRVKETYSFSSVHGESLSFALIILYCSYDLKQFFSVQGKADKNVQNSNLQTPLHLAVQGQHVEIVRVSDFIK